MIRALAIVAALFAPASLQAQDPLEDHEGIPNYNRITETISTAGQLSDDAIADVSAAGYKAVLNLRPVSEGSLEEKPKVERRGMLYYNIPVGRNPFTMEMVREFGEVVDEAANQPLMVHCASSNRVGAMWYLHQVLNKGREHSEALAEGKKAGLRSEALEQRVVEFAAAQQDP